MKDDETRDTAPGGVLRVLHDLTHKIPGVPPHDESRGLRHQNKAAQARHSSMNHRLNNKGGHGRHDREHERHVLPGLQNLIARIFGKS